MTRSQVEEWNALTKRMVEDPQPGDHFTDHLSPVALVLDRKGDDIKVAKPDRQKCGWDRGHWMSVSEFRKWLSYGSIPGYWAEGHRKGQMPWDKPTIDIMAAG